MSPVVDPVIEDYAAAHTTAPPPHLVDIAAWTRANMTAPGMMVGALEGRFLEMLVFALGPRQVLEIGGFTGYSALSMASALGPGGHITSCELDPTHAGAMRRHIGASPFADRITVLEGPALDSIASLDGPFDLVFIDADKAGYASYLKAVLPKLAEGGVVAVDNTLWSGRVTDDNDTSEDTVAIRAFNDAVAADPDLTCVVTTVRDGVTLIRRNADRPSVRERTAPAGA